MDRTLQKGHCAFRLCCIECIECVQTSDEVGKDDVHITLDFDLEAHQLVGQRDLVALWHRTGRHFFVDFLSISVNERDGLRFEDNVVFLVDRVLVCGGTMESVRYFVKDRLGTSQGKMQDFYLLTPVCLRLDGRPLSIECPRDRFLA